MIASVSLSNFVTFDFAFIIIGERYILYPAQLYRTTYMVELAGIIYLSFTEVEP
jgi:hypothetical protein